MKIHNKILGLMVSAVLLTGGSLVYAQANHNHTNNTPTAQHQDGKMQSGQMHMHNMHKKMKEHMKKMDVEMQRLMTAIDAAKGEDKVNLMADMLRKMVNHRQMMHKKMEGMHQQMMGQMKNHSMMKKMNNNQHNHQQ